MSQWERSQIALQLLTIDPKGLGGMAIRARSGPVREALLRQASEILTTITRLHPAMGHEDLLGGIDLASTLSAGSMKHHKGLLDRDETTLLLAMAERCPPHLAHILCSALDQGRDGPLLALDEGADETENLPADLSDRLALHIDLETLGLGDVNDAQTKRPAPQRTPLKQIETPLDLPEQLVQLCVSLGISSLRAPYFAMRAARANAALLGKNRVESEDLSVAVSLVLAPRATQLPQEDSMSEPEPQETEEPDTTQQRLDIPDELLLEAVKSALPPDVLAQLASGKAKAAVGSGSGQKKTGNRRGRPLPARNRRATSGARIDLMATLRAAVPWQPVRKREQPDRKGAIIRSEDLRAKRYQEHSDRLLIFTVDASGSAALARLGEAKGAVELLLAEAYARRDHVALIAFRGSEADELLPPTRSLVQTKRRLAELPGGGGTPTAAGISSALKMADVASRRGLTPTVILLTDGRSNVALDGSADRKKAAEDARQLAQSLPRLGVEALVIDTGNRPEAALASLARDMQAPYIALPRADAHKLSGAVTQALGD